MLKVHHLNNSRSQRIIWLLEEIEAPYEIVKYGRDPATRLAPPELKAIHPLGKSPVITDGDTVIFESGAIIEYLLAKYGKGRLQPVPGTPEALRHMIFMHYAEGSAMLPVMLAMYVGRLGDAGAPLHPRIFGELKNNMDYMESELSTRAYFAGDEFTGVDCQMTFILEAMAIGGRLAPYPKLTGYLARCQARPAYKRAIEKGGPYQLGA